MESVSLKAYAKINLLLAVTGRAENGYHTVETVMQAVTLADTVSVSAEPSKEESSIALTCSEPSLPCDASNLARQAAEAFFRAVPFCRMNVKIDIEKKIPIAGGMAGGSTDAAAVLLALNRLSGEALSKDDLLSLGAELGADVPFCILADSGEPAALGTHFGERMTPVPAIPDCTLIIASSSESVSTPWAYRQVDLLPSDREGCSGPMLTALREGDISAVFSSLYNRFEAAVLPERPLAAEQMRILKNRKADAVLMSGSGPTVVGFFAGPGRASRAECAGLDLEPTGRVWLCRPKRN